MSSNVDSLSDISDISSSDQHGEVFEDHAGSPDGSHKQATGGDDDVLVSESERDLQERRLQQCREALDHSRNAHEQWVDRLTRRRMFAISSFRKLQRARKDRMKFYDDVKVYIADNENIEIKDMTQKPAGL
ncbi:uncharacterized protein LOC128232396 isoform X2 [Mya arenaria]|uniref:uncharacterized protein LOC128232396 isoform X2 n=1 Tax=Mya arenaria TaxID=6604 RepID=UPI0022E7B6BF|nr:uncharacterized protein LOC128232396 isoform X2 [Mya arenaria]